MEAINVPRVHHHLEPMVVEYEFRTEQVIFTHIFCSQRYQTDSLYFNLYRR